MRSMDMGPKLLAAFGAGMILASIAFYVASLRRLTEPALPVASAQPDTIPTVVPQLEASPVQSPHLSGTGRRRLGHSGSWIPGTWQACGVEQSSRVKGTASMTLALTSITISDGQRIPIRTSGFLRKGDSSHGDDAGKIALGSAIGAVIGAAATGGKGAAIGAASGGAAGAGTVLATRGKAAVLDVETRLSFRLDDPVTITERH